MWRTNTLPSPSNKSTSARMHSANELPTRSSKILLDLSSTLQPGLSASKLEGTATLRGAPPLNFALRDEKDRESGIDDELSNLALANMLVAPRALQLVAVVRGH
eukprot:4318683-Amphidinium_carterae.1